MRHNVPSPSAPDQRSSRALAAHPALLHLAPGLVAATLALCSGCGGDEGVSYDTEIRPLVEARCVVCHHAENELSLVDPFDPERGLFVVKNTWFEGHGGLEYNVVPYEPEASFLMQKVTDDSLLPSSCDPLTPEEPCPIYDAGLFMPPKPPPATPDQVDVVRQWIADGAGDTSHFRERVVPFFGKWWSFTARSCREAGYQNFCVPCISCHFDEGPTTPNLKLPNFEDPALTTEEQNVAVAEWLETIVGVRSNFRADLDLVSPGNPEESFLLMKIAAEQPSSEVGASMPLGNEPLSEAQVATLRRWILEGARNN